MRRRWFLLLPVTAGCKAMDFEFEYAFMDGSPQTNTALAIRNGVGTLTRQVAHGAGLPIGLWRAPVSASTMEALWTRMPAAAPAGGPPLRPGMPNHLFKAKRSGVEKTVRLAHEPEVLDQVRPFLTSLEEAQKQAGGRALRTLAIRFDRWGPGGAVLELIAGGSEEVVIPNVVDVLQLMGAPEQNRSDARVVGAGPAGELRIAAGKSRVLTIPVTRAAGFVYQAKYKRYGNTPFSGTDVFGETSSAMAPQ